MSSVAIIGTRAPDKLQTQYAAALASELSYRHDVTIATGGAFGIDQAAMTGAKLDRLMVYLPWRSYNQSIVPWTVATIVVADPAQHPAWFASVDQYHPNPSALTRGTRALHARNFGIVQDRTLVLAFPNDQGGGGTGQGIRIAKGLGVPVLQFERGSLIPPYSAVLADILQLLRS